MAETSAKERLIALLGYCKELTTLHASDAKPTLELKSDDETTVLHETSLKRLQELKRTNGLPVLWLPEGGAAGLLTCAFRSLAAGGRYVVCSLYPPDFVEALAAPLFAPVSRG